MIDRDGTPEGFEHWPTDVQWGFLFVLGVFIACSVGGSLLALWFL